MDLSTGVYNHQHGRCRPVERLAAPPLKHPCGLARAGNSREKTHLAAMQVIYDLLVPNSAELPLREDPVLGAVPSGLTRVTVTTPRDVLRLLEDGNGRRKTERTDANACSSRSHAVFEVWPCVQRYM